MKLNSIISLVCSFVLALTLITVPVSAVEGENDPEGNEEIVLGNESSEDTNMDEDANNLTGNNAKATTDSESLVLEKTNIIINPHRYSEYEDEDEDVQYYYKTEYVQVLSGTVINVTSLDETIVSAQYDSNENRIKITPHVGGTTSIIATGDNNEESIITVVVNARPLKLSRTSITIDGSYNGYFYWGGYYEYYEDEDGDEDYKERRTYQPGYTILSSYSVYEMNCDEYEDDSEFFDDFKDNHYIYPTEGYITSIKSSNTNVVKVNSYDEIIPTGMGTATITCSGDYGEIATLGVRVTKTFMNSYVKKKVTMANIKYGSTKITGSAPVGVTVNIKIGKRKYKVKANSKGKYTVKKLPVLKIGTKVYYSSSYRGGSAKVTKKIVKPGVGIKYSRIYRKTKKVKITLTNVHKGDKVQLKIGKKKYSKKIKKDAKTFKYTVKIKKKKKAGTKITITVKNKFKQTMKTQKGKVYYASTIKKGMTKSQCKLVPGWEHPDEVDVNGKYTTWWYDDDDDGFANDSCLRFKRGKLIGWYY